MSKKNKIFVIVSSIIIILLLIFFSYRLIHFYKIEHPKGISSNDISLYDKLLSNSKDLYKDDKNYYFKGKNVDNYILFSGRMWRIVSLGEENSVKIISEEPQIKLPNSKNYKESNLRTWLNHDELVVDSGYFSKNINKSLITPTSLCLDKVSNKITCNEKYDDVIGLLSLYEYNKSGGKDSYLNNSSQWWLNTTTDKEVMYVSDGKVLKVLFDSYLSKDVRPVVTLNGSNIYRKGTGTLDDPFVIENRDVKTLKDTNVGEYINFNDNKWQIIDKNEKAVIVVLDGVIDTSLNYSDNNNTYNIKDKTSVAYYLNNTYYNSIKNKDYLLKGSFNLKNDVIEAYIGLLNINDLYNAKYEDTFLMSPGSNNTIYVIQNGLFADSIKNKHKLRPVIYLKNNIKVTGNDIYQLGGEVNER
ncbi:MAG: hypothetical protein RSB71_02705 [Bacilli bacterium]